MAPPLPRQPQIRAERALLRGEHAELIAWEWQYAATGDPGRDKALEALRAAASALRETRVQLAEEIQTASRRSEADLAKVQELRALGESEHAAGNHQASVDALAEARVLLGI